MSLSDRIRPFIPAPLRRARQSIIASRHARRIASENEAREKALNAIDPTRDLPELLKRKTCVTKLYSSSEHGKFAFYARDTIIGWSLGLNGEWEPHETALLRSLITPGAIIVDVGANLGWYSVQLAKALDGSGRVISFEPEPGNFLLLEENLAMNAVTDIVTANRVALLDTNGTVTFELSPYNYGDHRVRVGPAPKGVLDLYKEPTRETITVEAMTLDSALDRQQPNGRIRLLKMDCQGSEAAIALGAPRTLARTDYLATEFWPYGIRRTGKDPQQYLEILAANFKSFMEVTEANDRLSLQPIAGLAAHAAGITGNDEYRFYLLSSDSA